MSRRSTRWTTHRRVVQEINPLDEAVATIFRELIGKHGFEVPEKPREPLIAEVLSDPRALAWGGADVPCWVIEYRRGEAQATTWVRVSDGKVLRQEATLMGDRIALERETEGSP